MNHCITYCGIIIFYGGPMLVVFVGNPCPEFTSQFLIHLNVTYLHVHLYMYMWVYLILCCARPNGRTLKHILFKWWLKYSTMSFCGLFFILIMFIKLIVTCNLVKKSYKLHKKLQTFFFLLNRCMQSLLYYSDLISIWSGACKFH